MSGSLRPGQSWGTETSSAPDIEVTGTDQRLAGVLASGVTDPLVRFAASSESDLALAIGLTAGAALTGLALPLDVLDVTTGPDQTRFCAVNSVVIGVAPDRLRAWHRPRGLSVEIDGVNVAAEKATSLVLMNGQYLRRLDVSPRGHPGDGVAEAQLYALPPSARRAMRSRLTTGAHLPHPAITIRKARSVVVRAARPVPLEIDRVPVASVTAVELRLLPAAYRLLV